MRERAEVSLIIALGAFGILGSSALAFSEATWTDPVAATPQPVSVVVEFPVEATAADWFAGMRSHCNSVEVATHLSWTPAPATVEGTQYEAACWALAGRIDEAREALLTLPRDQQWQGAGVVFNMAHPAADAGDDLAAGPVMELVVEFWPNHYQALYHAGAAAYQRGEEELATTYLESFLTEYAVEDGWRSNAITMLEALR